MCSSLDAEYQELVAQVLPDLEWVDPWGHPRLEQPSEGGFEERVYSDVIGADPEWVVDGTLRGYDPMPRLHEIGASTLVISGRYDRVTPPSVAQAIFDGLASGAAPAADLRAQRTPAVGRATRRVLRARRPVPAGLGGFGEISAEPPGRAARPEAASSVAPIATAIGAPCVLASERASHPGDERHSAKPSQGTATASRV